MSLNRYAKRRDANEPEIVEALQKAGCTVQRLDVPCDLLVGKGARNFLIECKVPGGTLTRQQRDFIRDWRGQIRVVETAEEALDLIKGAYKCTNRAKKK